MLRSASRCTRRVKTPRTTGTPRWRRCGSTLLGQGRMAMADAGPRKPMAFEVVPDDPPPAPKRDTALLLLGLKTISQRAVAAIADLFTLVTVGSAFWLFLAIKEAPTTFQLVLAAMYALFVLAANWIVRRGT